MDNQDRFMWLKMVLFIIEICERCGQVSDKNQTVFITDMGTAWHTDRHCSGLKRTMDGMSQKEAEQSGLRPCSRCGVSGGGDA